ncbi:MAG: response regulator [Bacteroidota bacterium]
MKDLKVLIVEDDLIIGEDLSISVNQMGCQVLGIAIDVAEALEYLQKQETDLALIDINLAGAQNGIELAQIINSQYQIPFIFITSHSDKATRTQAQQTRPRAFLVKPFDLNKVRDAIHMALKKQ